MGNTVCNCNGKQEQKEIGLGGVDAYKYNENDYDVLFSDPVKSNNLMNSINTNYSKHILNKPHYIIRDVYIYIKLIKLQRSFRNFLNKRKLGYFDTFANKQNDKSFEYYGEYDNGQKVGFGIQKWKDGSMYYGYFDKNLLNNIGYFRHSDGDEYKGEFKADRACGFGLYKHENGNLYEGYWKDDKQNGIGIESWNNDSEYKGEFANGKKNGIGKYVWTDGSTYLGQWRDNFLDGYVRDFHIGNLLFYRWEDLYRGMAVQLNGRLWGVLLAGWEDFQGVF